MKAFDSASSAGFVLRPSSGNRSPNHYNHGRISAHSYGEASKSMTFAIADESAGFFPPTLMASNGVWRCTACGSSRLILYLQAPDRYHGRNTVYRLVCCRSCSLVWLDNAPSPAEMGKHYSLNYDRSVAMAGEEPGAGTAAGRRFLLSGPGERSSISGAALEDFLPGCKGRPGSSMESRCQRKWLQRPELVAGQRSLLETSFTLLSSPTILTSSLVFTCSNICINLAKFWVKSPDG